MSLLIGVTLSLFAEDNLFHFRGSDATYHQIIDGMTDRVMTWARKLNMTDEGLSRLGPPVVPFCPFLGEGSPSKIDYRKKGTLILTSLLEDLGDEGN